MRVILLVRLKRLLWVNVGFFFFWLGILRDFVVWNDLSFEICGFGVEFFKIVFCVVVVVVSLRRVVLLEVDCIIVLLSWWKVGWNFVESMIWEGERREGLEEVVVCEMMGRIGDYIR